MRKKILIFFTVVFAVLSAFAFAGCLRKKTETPPAGKREYVVFEDGYGKKYNMHGGEQITVYYDFDEEKVLEFIRIYYNEATGEERSRSEASVQLPCNKPTVYTCSASPLNADGNEEECSLTVIISAQEMSDQLVENSYHPVSTRIHENAGAVYTFIPEWNGRYTVSCESEDDGGEVTDVTVTDRTGSAVEEDGIFKKGWTYYVHIKVKSEEYHKSVYVSTRVKLTPPVVELGENEITFVGDGLGSLFEFTPEESGIYTAVSTDCGFTFLDAETYGSVSINTHGEAAVLEAGKRYIIDSSIGHQTERQGTLTVKRVDRVFAADTENQMNWAEAYVFTAEKSGNYNFKVSEDHGYGATAFKVYRENGRLKYGESFVDSGEFNLVLEAGKYVLSVSHSGKATASYAPKRLSVGEYANAKNGETLLFTAPFDCVYEFTAWRYDDAVITVTDKDGNSVDGERLTAGEEYEVVPTFSTEYGYDIAVKPITDGEIFLNRAFNPAAGNLYEFTPDNMGITFWYGTYKFVGASVPEIYDDKCEAVETDGGTVTLRGNSKYYAVFADDTEEEVKYIYYPEAIPFGTDVKIVKTGYMRIELAEGCEVSILINHIDEAVCDFLDADMNEIESFELTKDERLSTLTHTFEDAGIYYLFVEHYGTVPTISFATRPVGCTGNFSMVSGVTYTSDTAAECRFENVADKREITVRINKSVGSYGIMDCVKVYYETETGNKRYLNLYKLNGDYFSTEFSFKTLNDEKTYFIEVVGGMQFKIK